MSAGLTRQGLRRHLWSFAGPAATQALAATIVTASFLMLRAVASGALTPAQRGAIEQADVASMAAVFMLISVYLTIVIVAVTMSTAVARQVRDIALVWAVGATPGQVRRAVARQAGLVAVPATGLGVVLGYWMGGLWFSALTRHRIIPDHVPFGFHGWALPVAFVAVVPTSLAGAFVAAARTSRTRPAAALTDVATGRRGHLLLRALLGSVLVVGGVVLSVAVSRGDAAKAGDASFFVLLALCVGVGLLGPVLLGAALPVLAVPLRLFGWYGRLAVDNVRVLSVRLSAALVPVTLAVAFALVKIGWHLTLDGEGRDGSAASRWLDYTGTAVYGGFALVAAVSTLISVTSGRRTELTVFRLTGATRGQVLAVLGCEALVFAIVATVLAGGVTAATLVPLVRATVPTSSPVVPGWLIAAAIGVVLTVAAGSTIGPAALGMRHRVTPGQ